MNTIFLGAVEGSPGSRSCCLLAPETPLPNQSDRILEVSDITNHKYGNSGLYSGPEKWGLIYTCAAGFIDIGHMRDMIDLTKFYYTVLLTKRKFKVFKAGASKDIGEVEILRDITTPADQTAVAMSIAYDQSVWHEIASYWECQTGMHASSFSPEDCVSNKFGVYIGGKITRTAN